MATTTYIIEQIKLEGSLKDLIAKSNGENVTVNYNGSNMTLAAALASIYSDVTSLPTDAGIDTKISTAIDNLIGGAPETYNTLKKISDYISTHGSEAAALTATVANKVDKVNGKGLSAEDFTTALKTKLENMISVSASDVTKWNNKADKTEATQSVAGLMSAADKKRLDTLRGVRYGISVPDDMQEGELFVHIVSA